MFFSVVTTETTLLPETTVTTEVETTIQPQTFVQTTTTVMTRPQTTKRSTTEVSFDNKLHFWGQETFTLERKIGENFVIMSWKAAKHFQGQK